jgi:uncharacterized protein
MQSELDYQQIQNLLSIQNLGRLACVDGEMPYIIPISYTYDGKFIYGQTNLGKKLSLLRRNANVCFEVDQMLDMRNWQSVIVHGIFEELHGKANEEAREIFNDREYPIVTPSKVHGHEHAVDTLLTDDSRIKKIMFRIQIVKITGRSEKE